MDTIAFGMPGGSELLVILFIVLLLFGAKKLPELSRALGKSLGEFQKGKADFEREVRETQDGLKTAAEIKEEPRQGAAAGPGETKKG